MLSSSCLYSISERSAIKKKSNEILNKLQGTSGPRNFLKSAPNEKISEHAARFSKKNAHAYSKCSLEVAGNEFQGVGGRDTQDIFLFK